MAQDLKRKRAGNASQSSNPPQPSKRRKASAMHDARVISTQTSGKAFGNGGVDVDKFVKAREYEIKALEDSMRRSKAALNTRAFQHVPRDMRRRTASHNVKRVPKRLQARAAEEMAEDNTPTVNAKTRKKTSRSRLRLDTVKRLQALGAGTKISRKNRVSDAALAAVARGKQRAIVTKPPRIKTNALAKPAQPKAKFRKRQIHKAWLPTHLYHAKRAHMTPPSAPLWRMSIPLSPTAKSYRPTHRASNARGVVAWDMSYMSTILIKGPEANVLRLCRQLAMDKKGMADRKWLSGSRYWEGWLLGPEDKTSDNQREAITPATIVWQAETSSTPSGPTTRQAMIRVHPSAFLQLWNMLLPLVKGQRPACTMQDLRFEIGSMELMGPASTEALHTLLRPRGVHQDDLESRTSADQLWDVIGRLTNPSTLPQNIVLAMEVADPRLISKAKSTPTEDDLEHQRLLAILTEWPLDDEPAISSLFDQQARHTAKRQMPSQKAINRRKTANPGALQPLATDPAIPILMFASRGPGTGLQGTWTLMMPRKCLLPFWYCLMHQRTSGGGAVRFGGLNEKRQTLFEIGKPWFPADYPGTSAGRAWEEREAEVRKAAWERRPKAKRSPEFEGACEWNLLVGEIDATHVPSAAEVTALKVYGTVERINCPWMKGLVTVQLQLVSGGVATECARIYTLPRNDKQLRVEWLTKPANRQRLVLKDLPPHKQREQLAAQLLDGPHLDGKASKHKIPREEDLMGFVTTGSYNLSAGQGTGIGSILFSKVLDASKGSDGVAFPRSEHQLCIVRNPGQNHGRLARWEMVAA